MKTLALGSLLALVFGATAGFSLRAAPPAAFTGPRVVVAEALTGTIGAGARSAVEDGVSSRRHR